MAGTNVELRFVDVTAQRDVIKHSLIVPLFAKFARGYVLLYRPKLAKLRPQIRLPPAPTRERWHVRPYATKYITVKDSDWMRSLVQNSKHLRIFDNVILVAHSVVIFDATFYVRYFFILLCVLAGRWPFYSLLISIFMQPSPEAAHTKRCTPSVCPSVTCHRFSRNRKVVKNF